MKIYKVVIAEDHTTLRNEIKSLLGSEDNIEVVDDVEDGIKAVQSAAKHQPDLIVMDLSMPGMNGIEAIQEIKRFASSIKILVLTVYNNDEYVTAALKAGANGYVIKDAKHSDLKMAVRHILDGNYYLSRSGGLEQK